jgi:hypothetical protein
VDIAFSLKYSYTQPHVTNISTKKAKARQDSWISGSISFKIRSKHLEAPPPKRPQAHYNGLTPLCFPTLVGYHAYLLKRRSRKAKYFMERLFHLRIGKNRSRNRPAKAAVIVSKKIDTRATKRNALRRKGYHALESLLSNGQTGIHFAFFCQKRRRGQIGTSL